jgi:hypothetical protein
MIKSRRMMWAGHVAHMVEVRNVLVGESKGRDHSEDLGVDGRIILKWMLRNMVGECGMDSSGSG